MKDLITRAELAVEAEALAAGLLPEGAERTISERTIRYWTAKGFLKPANAPGRAASYRRDAVYRCVFIRRLQALEALSLSQIRGLLLDLDEGTIRRVVESGEPIEFANTISARERKSRMGSGEEMVEVRSVALQREHAPAAERDSETDGPAELQLQRTSDQQKCRALMKAFRTAGAGSIEIQIDRVRYASLHRWSFRQPTANVGIVVKPLRGVNGDAEGLDPLHEIVDQDLCDQVAKSLTALTAEPYRVSLLIKKYSRHVGAAGAVREAQFEFEVVRDGTGEPKATVD
ncbi:MAG: MerR family transcriptional regulator [Pseudomonadales bacterium]|nr:MerR family transcriptional regulator [Pseudomonadales bacterium]